MERWVTSYPVGRRSSRDCETRPRMFDARAKVFVVDDDVSVREFLIDAPDTPS
jgi:hypothetical protein